MDILMKLLETFSIHKYANVTQLRILQCQKNNFNPGEIIMNEDFSENYSNKHKDENVSAHWSTEAITIFCAKAHYPNGNK